jgi:hypothetical protein
MTTGAATLRVAWRRGDPLVITVPVNNRRIIAGLLILERGLLFADIGWSWPLNVRHPFHWVGGGAITGHDPWYIGTSSIVRMNDSDSMFRDWLDWRAYETGRTADPVGSAEGALWKFAQSQELN